MLITYKANINKLKFNDKGKKNKNKLYNYNIS